MLVSVQGAHTVDLAVALLGPWAELTALTTTQYPEIESAIPRQRNIASRRIICSF